MKPLAVTLLSGFLLVAPAFSKAGMPTEPSSSPVGVKTPLPRRPGTHVWIERPWQARYVLFVSPAYHWNLGHTRAGRSNAELKQTYFFWEEFFNSVAEFPAPIGSTLEEAIAVVLIEFDQQGLVVTSNSHAGPLRGRINRLQYLTLSSGDEPGTRNYDLGVWFTGLGDISTEWAPGLCRVDQKPDPAMVRSDTYLYGRLFKPDEFSTTFGCREWAYQLYDRERPYIDVTSYVPKGETYPHGSYIREFIGWARFEDHKPIIGKHGAHWYCVHDCPKGAKPGLIPDIKAWAADNGWPVPKRPNRMPVFPDPPGKQGVYP